MKGRGVGVREGPTKDDVIYEQPLMSVIEQCCRLELLCLFLFWFLFFMAKENVLSLYVEKIKSRR